MTRKVLNGWKFSGKVANGTNRLLSTVLGESHSMLGNELSEPFASVIAVISAFLSQLLRHLFHVNGLQPSDPALTKTGHLHVLVSLSSGSD